MNTTDTAGAKNTQDLKQIGAGSGNRTRTSSLGSLQAAITSYPPEAGLPGTLPVINMKQ